MRGTRLFAVAIEFAVRGLLLPSSKKRATAEAAHFGRDGPAEQGGTSTEFPVAAALQRALDNHPPSDTHNCRTGEADRSFCIGEWPFQNKGTEDGDKEESRTDCYNETADGEQETAHR